MMIASIAESSESDVAGKPFVLAASLSSGAIRKM